MENNMIQASKPMDLSGTYNTRELGGYPLEGGGSTKSRACLRSDGLYAVTIEDKKFLKDYGVGRIIDLRTIQETIQQPCIIGEAEGIEYFNIPLEDQISSEGFKGAFPESMSQLYIGLLDDRGSQIAEILKKIAQCQKTVLFNCAAGKDRTGIIAMLLLLLCKVPKEVILRDYEVSGKNMLPVFDKQKEMLQQLHITIPEYVFESDRREMEKTICYLEERWKTAEEYMKSIGLNEEIDQLKEKLT